MLTLNIGYFLPLREKVIFSGGRKRRLMMPLFTSYVFFCGTEKDRYNALTTNRLCQTIEVCDQARLLNELTNIRRALSSKTVVDNYPRLAVGTRARIAHGPMMGIEGVVIEKKSEKARMVLEVTLLGQAP